MTAHDKMVTTETTTRARRIVKTQPVEEDIEAIVDAPVEAGPAAEAAKPVPPRQRVLIYIGQDNVHADVISAKVNGYVTDGWALLAVTTTPPKYRLPGGTQYTFVRD